MTWGPILFWCRDWFVRSFLTDLFLYRFLVVPIQSRFARESKSRLSFVEILFANEFLTEKKHVSNFDEPQRSNVLILECLIRTIRLSWRAGLVTRVERAGQNFRCIPINYKSYEGMHRSYYTSRNTVFCAPLIFLMEMMRATPIPTTFKNEFRESLQGIILGNNKRQQAENDMKQ